MKTATYTGPADRYYEKDGKGRRHYLVKGVPTQVPDEVADKLQGRKNITVDGVTGAKRATEEAKKQ